MIQSFTEHLQEIYVKKWHRGYIWVAIVMIIPSLARIGSAPTPIDAVFFYIVSVGVWGTVLSVILSAWDQFQSGKAKE